MRKFFLFLLAAPAFAQFVDSSHHKLSFLVPELYGPQGLKLPSTTTHNAHFDSGFQANFGPFNTAIASQLTSLPLPSPASGFIFTLDPALGVPTRTTQSFGPIFAERAETLGKGKFVAGFNNQFFRFKTIDGIDLRKFPAVFEHSETADLDFKRDIITTQNFFDVAIDQHTVFFTYGLHDRVDLSIAAPFVTARLGAVSNATIQRLGTGSIPEKVGAHYFNDASGGQSTQKQFAANGTASGLGDVTLRVKGTILQTSSIWIAGGADLRMPTGDEYDFWARAPSE